jgi:hypothetical protein
MERDIEGIGQFICHSEPFTFCHPEQSEGPYNSQDRLRGESRPLDIAQRDRIDNKEVQRVETREIY